MSGEVTKVYIKVMGETSSIRIHELMPLTRNRLDWLLGVKRPKGALITRRTGAMKKDSSENHFRASVHLENEKSLFNEISAHILTVVQPHGG